MKNEIVEFRNALEIFDAKNTDKLVQDFEEMLAHGISPTMFWECKAHGAFKECYDVKEPNFIIKFASNANATEIEEKTLSLAIDEGFENTFPKTIYIPLSTDLPVSLLENYGSYEYRYTYHTYCPVSEDDRVFLNYVIIQKRVVETAANHPNNENISWDENIYNNNPIFIEGKKIPYGLLWDTGIDSSTWIIDIIKRRGYKYFTDLSDFLSGNCIKDLHNGNIGYGVDGEPLIFDWLS